MAGSREQGETHDPKDLLTPKEAAKELGYGIRTFREKAKNIPHVELPNRGKRKVTRRFLRSEIEKRKGKI